MSEGIYFTKIAVLGINKRPAEISLTKGLNVIYGPSDTGKSYILECLNYLLAGKDEPKQIPQAQGYQRIQAEIRVFDGKTVTLSRNFKDSKIYMAECPFEEFDRAQHIKLSSRHSEFTDNVSMYLLSLLQLNNKIIKYTVYNDKKKLSFRDLARLCLIKEDRIITEKSPIYENIVYDESESKSVFKLFLTGQDDKDLPDFENPENGKSRIRGKIDLIKADIEKRTKELAELRKTSQQLTSEEINVQIQKLLTIVEDAHREIAQQDKERAEIYSEMNHLEAVLLQNEELKKRFELLNRSYSSDLSRLEFINEGKSGIDQLKDRTCPLCDSEIDSQLLEPHDEMGLSLLRSIRAEYSKIARKQSDLSHAIEDADEKIEATKHAIADRSSQFKKVNEYIANKLKPVHAVNSESLNQFMKLRSTKAKADLIESQITDLNISLTQYGRILEQAQEKAPPVEVPVNYYAEFCINVQEILTSWRVNGPVTFDLSTDDITINNKSRRNFGKGYRAIFFSAFMMGLLQHSLRRKSGHPRFLVLDSPLTTFKGKNRGPKDNEEEIPPEISEQFFEGIANLDYLQRIQVIILDNREPPDSVKGRINHIYFSKTHEPNSRYGFFPT